MRLRQTYFFFSLPDSAIAHSINQYEIGPFQTTSQAPNDLLTDVGMVWVCGLHIFYILKTGGNIISVGFGQLCLSSGLDKSYLGLEDFLGSSTNSFINVSKPIALICSYNKVLPQKSSRRTLNLKSLAQLQFLRLKSPFISRTFE